MVSYHFLVLHCRVQLLFFLLMVLNHQPATMLYRLTKHVSKYEDPITSFHHAELLQHQNKLLFYMYIVYKVRYKLRSVK
jgi:hypothetical protein